MQLLMSGILNVTQLVGVSTSIWTMDVVGRRGLLLSGALVMTLCHVIIAVLVGLFSANWPAHTAEGWASVAMLFLYMLAYGATWGPVGWALPSGLFFSLPKTKDDRPGTIIADRRQSEIFPSSLRAKGVAISTCSNWLNNFIIVSHDHHPENKQRG